MASPTCLCCGYSRAVQVAGCDHATLPAARCDASSLHGDALCELRAGHGGLHQARGTSALYRWEVARGTVFVADAENHERQLQGAMGFAFAIGMEAASAIQNIEKATEMVQALLGAQDRLTESLWASRREADRLRAEAAILGPELVDLQRQVVALQQELEEERRVSGRLRADLERTQQLLSEAEGGSAAAEVKRLRAFIVEFDEAYSERDGGHQRGLRHTNFDRFRRAVQALSAEADKARGGAP